MATGRPIVTDRDAQIRSAVRKYTRPDPLLARQLSRSTPTARSGLRRLDADRLSKGQRALTQPQSAVGLKAASTGESSVGRPNQSMAGDFVRNVTELAGGIPRLPVAIGKEILELPNAPKEAAAAVERADSPLEAIGNVADVPGVRMVPGSFIASQFGTDKPGWKGVTDDPLFSVLDVLPYASKAARATPAVRRAQSVVDEAGTGERVGAFSTAARFKAQPRTTPVDPRVTTMRGATVRNALEPTRLGEGLERLGARARQGRAGNLMAKTWGANSMQTAQVANRLNAELNIPRFTDDPDIKTLQSIRTRAEEAQSAFREAGGDDVRIAAIAEDLRQGVDDLSPLERDYVNTYRGLLDEYEQVRMRSPIRDEQLVETTFTTPDGRTITDRIRGKDARPLFKAREKAQAARLLTTADDMARGTRTLNADEFAATTSDLAAASLDLASKRQAARALIESADAAGLRVSGFKTNKQGRAVIPDKKEALDAALAKATATPARARTAIPDIRRSVMSHARTDPTVSRLVGLIDAKQFQAAGALARRLSRRSKFVGGLDWSGIADDLTAYGRRERAAATLASTRPARTLRKAEKKLAAAEAAAMPERLRDVVTRRTADIVAAEKLPELQAQGALTPKQAADAAAVLADGLGDFADFPKVVDRVFKNVRADVQRSWLELVDEGHNPTFVHRVQSGSAGRQVQVSGNNPSLTGAKKSVYDWGSTVNDIMVSIDHAAAELLARRGHAQFMGQMADTFGRDLDTLRAQYADWTQQALERNPRINRQEHMKNLIRRDWRPINVPERIGPDGTVIPARESWVPRDMADAIDGLAPKDLGVIGRAFDPVMNVFRTALLPLSIRWHVYNATGGAIMATAESGLGVWRKMPEAWRIAKGKVDDADSLADVRNLPQMAGGAAGRKLRENVQWGRTTDLTTKFGKAIAAWETSAGSFLRRMWDEAAQKGSSVVDRSYAMNEMVDDMFRSMAYLHGTDKALRKGLTREAAEQQGVMASRRILQSWDRLTPMERTVIRNVFPFYSWAKHLLGWTARYPLDHPWRTAFTASIVQAELDDYGTGLPQMFFSLLDVTGAAGRLGIEPDEGHSAMLNLEGMNPFKDVGSYATLVGFLASPLTGDDGDVGSLGAVTSQMNPATQVFLRSIGVDPAEGTPDLYAGVSYDPVTGGLRTNIAFDPLTDTVQAILPQSKIAFDLAGVNRDYQKLVRSNPDAAFRRHLSSAGLPILGRQMDTTAETIKAEVRRFEDMQRTRATALREGNLGKLGRYEALKPLQGRLREAQRRGDLERLTAPRDRADIGEILARADREQGPGSTSRRSALG